MGFLNHQQFDSSQLQNVFPKNAHGRMQMFFFREKWWCFSTPEVDDHLGELQNVHQLSEHVMVVTGGGAFQFIALDIGGLKLVENATEVISYQYIPSKIEWDLTNGPRSVSCETELLDTQVFSGSVQCVLLEISWSHANS